jgi:hypothetical protein
MSTTILGGKNTIRKIDKVWAVVSVDPTDQTEGICAVQINGQWMPLLAADEERLVFLKEQMYRLAFESPMSLRLIELSTRTVIEEHMQ